MSLPSGPRAWAGHLTRLLNLSKPEPERFPLIVAELATEFTKNVFPDDPIRRVGGDSLPGFEGALMPLVGMQPGWCIAYNSDIRSPGRINFTLAHELGHYLVHRQDFPGGINCSENDITHATRDIEREADLFAADLLMPFDDYRRQIPARQATDIPALSACADRYGVSLLAVVSRWISYTERRAVLVVSRDGFILWARSSDSAFKSGAFFRTSRETVALPGKSLAARQDLLFDNRSGSMVPAGVWFGEEVKEMTVFSDQYDIAVSLLVLSDAEPRWAGRYDSEEDAVAVPVDIKFR